MFGGGGGGLDPRKMQQMMEQMGIDMEDLDAEEVVIRTPEEELVFGDAEVQRMTAQGQETYQIVGEPESRERGTGAGDAGAGDVSESEADDGADEDASGDAAVPQEDVELVAMRADASESEAREALEAADGDLAGAVERLE